MEDKLQNLLKKNDGTTATFEGSLEESRKYANTKKAIKEICIALSKETKRYIPEETVNRILKYLEFEEKVDRILYSEISSYIFSLDMILRGTFATNVENLMIYALDKKDISEDCRKIIIKIYDHCQLALYQIENVQNILGASIEDTKVNLKDEIRGIEKEYISILGIFASIVLAFVGGITFSSSVLQNIGNVSIYRLLMVVLILACVLVNLIWMLVHFIVQTNGKNIKIFEIRIFNLVCVAMALLIVCAWGMNIQKLPEFFARVLPWWK